MALYDLIGTGYDFTRRADSRIVQRLIHYLRVKPCGRYLDVACGTGNYTLAIAATANAQIHGIDQSRRMIESAREKSSSMTWCMGSVESLPFAENTFSGATCVLGIHHFKALRAAFREIFRVLASGQFVLFTATSEQMEGYWLNEYFPDAMERSIRQMPGLESIVKDLKLAGFRSVHTKTYQVSNQLQDLFLYSGKHRPEIYLNPQVRNGISTFADLADCDEIEEGCKRLSLDIQSGRVAEVMGAYSDDAGDYLFVVAGKMKSGPRQMQLLLEKER